MLVSDLITLAFINLGFITVNETISPAMQADAFTRLNPLIDSFSAEGLVVPTEQEQTFALVANTVAYTFGVGGTFNTAARPIKATAWRAFYQNILHSGGRVLSIAEFDEQAKQLLGETTAIPGIVGADTAFPLINVRVFPPPGATPGQLALAFWTPVANFVTVGDTITMPQGWINLLSWHLAQQLYAQYPRPSQRDTIWDMCQRSKTALMSENAMTAPQNPQPAAPQGQQ